MSALVFSAADFVSRAARPAQGAEHGDHVLNPGFRDEFFARPFKDAAVLIGVVDRPEGARIILTKRTERLRSHSGQVALPGGRIDAGDGSAARAALREAEEEIGLGADFVDIIGQMPDYLTGSGYRIAPVLGLVRPGFDLRINADEVDEAFEIPLELAMNGRNFVQASRVWSGHERFYWTLPHERHHIWGVTAGILHAVSESLYP
ncbi:MAG: CoA pyrophosphatase [Rhizobiaceae bacterium]